MRKLSIIGCILSLFFQSCPINAGLDPYVGEIAWVPYNFAPQGWAFCNGQLLPISSNAQLFTLIGNRFGGNGTTNFALPNLQGRTIIGVGAATGGAPHSLGQTGGAETASLTNSLSTYLRDYGATQRNGRNNDSPDGNQNLVEVALADSPVSIVQPYLTLNCIIALVGIAPT